MGPPWVVQGDAFMFAVLRYYSDGGDGLCHLILEFVSIVLQLCRHRRVECLMWKRRLCGFRLFLPLHRITPLREATTWRWSCFMRIHSQNCYLCCYLAIGYKQTRVALWLHRHLRSDETSFNKRKLQTFIARTVSFA